jgi:hypothetical protein
MHPQFYPDLLDYDAAILTLRNLIRYDTARRAIQLPFTNEVFPVGLAVITNGWGLTQNENETSLYLRQVELKVTSQRECNTLYIDDGGVTSRMICAGADAKDSCKGGVLNVKKCLLFNNH